jgi:hypothetical protein
LIEVKNRVARMRHDLWRTTFFTRSRLVQAEPRCFSNWARGFAVFVRAPGRHRLPGAELKKWVLRWERASIDRLRPLETGAAVSCSGRPPLADSDFNQFLGFKVRRQKNLIRCCCRERIEANRSFDIPSIPQNTSARSPAGARPWDRSWLEDSSAMLPKFYS